MPQIIREQEMSYFLKINNNIIFADCIKDIRMRMMINSTDVCYIIITYANDKELRVRYTDEVAAAQDFQSIIDGLTGGGYTFTDYQFQGEVE